MSAAQQVSGTTTNNIRTDGPSKNGALPTKDNQSQEKRSFQRGDEFEMTDSTKKIRK